MDVILAAIITFIGLSFLFLKLPRNWQLRIIGYDALTDLTISGLLAWLFGMTAAISGLMIAILTGVFVSIALFIAKRTVGFQKLQRFRWVEHEAIWATKINAKLADEIISDVPNNDRKLIQQLAKQKWTSAKVEHETGELI